MRALSIRQPFAEAILRGLKTIEYRTIATRVIGERFYIYASSQPGAAGRFKKLDNQIDKLPKGVIVGTAVITKCSGVPGDYEWHLADVRRLKRLRRPKRKPQPVWFNPF